MQVQTKTTKRARYDQLNNEYLNLLQSGDRSPENRRRLQTITKQMEHLMNKTNYQNYMNWCQKEMETGHSPSKRFFNSLKAKHSH